MLVKLQQTYNVEKQLNKRVADLGQASPYQQKGNARSLRNTGNGFASNHSAQSGDGVNMTLVSGQMPIEQSINVNSHESIVEEE